MSSKISSQLGKQETYLTTYFELLLPSVKI